MISSYSHETLYYTKPPLRNHTEPFCRRFPPTKSFGLLRGGFLYIPREFADGRPACNSSYPHLESYMSRLDLDTVPRPRTNAGEPDNAAATQGQERRFGANGAPCNRRTLLLTPALPALETEIRFEICIFNSDRKSDKQVSTCSHNFKN